MRKIYVSFSLLFITCATWAQNTGWQIPTNAANVAKQGSGPSPMWTNTGTLNHNGMAFSPMGPGGGGSGQNASDWLYLNNFDLNLPLAATIDGIELIVNISGCNSGDYHLDTFALAHNGNILGAYKQDSVSDMTDVDTFGSAMDTWSAMLTPGMVNSPSFGIFYSYTTYGICTIVLFDCRLRVHYSMPTGVKGVAYSKDITVHPNPATSEITISRVGPKSTSYHIYDQVGRQVVSGAFDTDKVNVDISNLSSGVYFIKQSGTQLVTKFIKL